MLTFTCKKNGDEKISFYAREELKKPCSGAPAISMSVHFFASRMSNFQIMLSVA